jgi:hypothetical protein
MMKPLPRYKPGQKQLSAEALNRQLDVIDAVSGITGDGIDIDQDGGGLKLTGDKRHKCIFAKITSVAIVGTQSRYGWIQQFQTDSGQFIDHENPMQGTPDFDYATDVCPKRAVPIGIVVVLWRGIAATDVNEELRDNWHFSTSDLTEVVLVDYNVRNGAGHYSAEILRWVHDSAKFERGQLIWVVDPNDQEYRSSNSSAGSGGLLPT